MSAETYLKTDGLVNNCNFRLKFFAYLDFYYI